MSATTAKTAINVNAGCCSATAATANTLRIAAVTYILTIEASHGDQWRGVPVIVRLRRLVKGMGRGYGFKLVDIREAKAIVEHD